jgi:hypothetical protein
MRLRMGLIGLGAALLCAGGANAATMRVVVVQTTDVAGYVKAMEDGKALLKKKGSSAQIHVWVARYAGTEAGNVVVSVEYPNMETLAKDENTMRTDPELSGWLGSLSKYRKIVSDSIYEELKP